MISRNWETYQKGIGRMIEYCGHLNKKLPPFVHVFEHLVPIRWCSLEVFWGLMKMCWGSTSLGMGFEGYNLFPAPVLPHDKPDSRCCGPALLSPILWTLVLWNCKPKCIFSLKLFLFMAFYHRNNNKKSC